MKKIILVGDGMGDYPLKELGGKTPLQAADIPNIRKLSAAGKTVLARPVPDGMKPGSDVANLSLLGYDPACNYTGRAPIEAAGAGVPLRAQDVAFRCNLVTVNGGDMHDYSAGHITTEEAGRIVDDLQKKLGTDRLHFHRGVSYRHLLVWADGPVDLETWPPHDIADQPIASHLPTGERQDEVRRLMAASVDLLRDHPVNCARRAAGRNPATQIWLWGQGRAAKLKTFQELYGLSGGVVTAVDLVRGLGRLAGLEAPVIPGATGFLDTNFAGKVAAALDILSRKDFVFVHVEAPDECGHIGDLKKKIQAIELFDREVVGPIWRALEARGQPYRLILATDHRTPVTIKGHTAEPIPLAVCEGPTGPLAREAAYDEFIAPDASAVPAHQWISGLLK